MNQAIKAPQVKSAAPVVQVAVPSLAPDSAALIAVIERIATNPEADISKLEKMLDMQERIFNRNAEQAFNADMARAQSEMGTVSADAENPQTRSKYASYAALDRAVRPIYTKYGFALSFNTEGGAPEGCVRVICIVSHLGGHSRRYTLDMPADGLGAKGNAVMTKTHAAGSAMSYGQRYLLKLIFNVAVGENDDDGNSANIHDDWLAAVESAATLEDLQQLKADGESTYVKARNVPRYKEFMQAVSARMKALKEASHG